MAQQVIITGNTASDGTGDPLRTAFTKINQNFTELYSGNVQVTAANIRVYSVAGRVGNVVLTVNDVAQAASKGYVDSSIASNLSTFTTVTNSLRANINAANAVISNHTSRITTLESNASSQAVQINSLVAVKANVSYVDTSIAMALSSNAILANVASINANVAAANAAILLRANLSGANFTGNITANFISSSNFIRSNTYFIGGSLANQGLGEQWANPAALFFGNSALSPGPGGSRYYQINLQNLDPAGSGDLVVTADDGNDQSNYIAIGVNGSQYADPAYPYGQPHDTYVWSEGGVLALVTTTDNIVLMASNVGLPQVIISKSNIMDLINNTVIRFSDGTVQSTAFGGNADLSSINANVTAANLAITNLQSNAASQQLEIGSLINNAASQGSAINNLTANAGTQATAINTLNSNIGSYQTFANSNASSQATSINLINANITAANVNIASLLSNSATQALELNNLQGNSQSQQTLLSALQSNSAIQAVQIDLLNSNLSAANSNIDSLTSNSATQGSQINLINANIAAANVNITNLQSNAAIQALDIDNLYANINSYLGNLDIVNANVAAANAKIITIDANLGSATSNITTLQGNVASLISNAATQATAIDSINANVGAYQIFANSNAATQTTQINLINANVAAANINKADLSGAIFSGNVQADYLLANANVIAVNGIFESIQATNSIDYPGLGSRFIGNVDGYFQLVVQNLSNDSNASGDIVVTADVGDDTNNYIVMGINSSTFTAQWQNTIFYENPLDGYIECVGGNIALRTTNNVFIVAGNSLVILNQDANFILFNTNLQFYDGTVQSTAISDVPGLFANIGTLETRIDTLNANVGAYENYANANIGTITTSLGTLDSNIGAYQIYANANAATQSLSIDSIDANIGAYQIYANANSAIQALSIDALFAKELNLDANITAANIEISNLRANINAANLEIVNVVANAGSQATSINTINANIGSFQTYANIELANLANLSGAIFNGNVQADYIIANSNVKIGSTLEVGLPSTLNLPELTNHFVGNANTFYRLNLQNISNQNKAVGEFRVTADDGTITNKYAGFGLTGSTFTGNYTVPAGDTGIPSYPYDGYMITIGGNASVVTDSNVYLLANTAIVGLRKDSDFFLGPNVRLQFDDLSILANANIGAQSYTPNNAANYNTTISNIQQALDELAARLRALGG